MAALSHIPVVVPMLGVIAPIVIWATQKDKSRYVAFQSLQAVAFQLTMILAWFVGMACYMGSSIAMFFPIFLSSENSQMSDPLLIFSFLIPVVVFGVIFLGGFFFIIYGIVGAIMAFQGKPFRYLLIGKWVERFLQPKENNITTA